MDFTLTNNIDEHREGGDREPSVRLQWRPSPKVVCGHNADGHKAQVITSWRLYRRESKNAMSPGEMLPDHATW